MQLQRHPMEQRKKAGLRAVPLLAGALSCSLLDPPDPGTSQDCSSLLLSLGPGPWLKLCLASILSHVIGPGPVFTLLPAGSCDFTHQTSLGHHGPDLSPRGTATSWSGLTFSFHLLQRHSLPVGASFRRWPQATDGGMSALLPNSLQIRDRPRPQLVHGQSI